MTMNEELAASPRVLAWIAIGTLALLIGVAFLFDALGIVHIKVFGVAQENAQTEVYEHSKVYRDGARRDFDELLLSYEAAKTDGEKQAILNVMRHRSEGIPPELVPSEVRRLTGLP